MKPIKSYIRNIFAITIAGVAICMSMTSCEDYLNIKPKKNEIPSTLAQYIALFNYESQTSAGHSYVTLDAGYLFGENYNAWIDYYGPTDPTVILYKWTDGDRYEGSSTNVTINCAYRGIAVANQLINGVPDATECTETERQEVICGAKVLRTLHLFHANSYFAHAYDPATADSELSIPYQTECGLEVTYSQPTQKELFDFIVSELQEVIDNPDVPTMGRTILMPGKAAAYAMMARVQLHIRNYQQALDAAEKALSFNSELFDWVQFYNENYEEYYKEWTSAKRIDSPMDRNFCENYYYGTGNTGYPGRYSYNSMNLEAADLFETGDHFFKCSYIVEPYSKNFLAPTWYGFYNLGGLRTIEQYLIKAECQARLGNVEGACQTLNTVRKNFFDASTYEDFSTTSADEAIIKVRDFKHTALIHSTVELDDAKRFNREGKYVWSPKKIIDGEMRTLKPNDRLWTWPIPQNVLTNTIYGEVTQIQPD